MGDRGGGEAKDDVQLGRSASTSAGGFGSLGDAFADLKL
jgi:hypothetical protein